MQNQIIIQNVLNRRGCTETVKEQAEKDDTDENSRTEATVLKARGRGSVGCNSIRSKIACLPKGGSTAELLNRICIETLMILYVHNNTFLCLVAWAD